MFLSNGPHWHATEEFYFLLGEFYRGCLLEEADSQKDDNINIISLPWWVVLWRKVRIISICVTSSNFNCKVMRSRCNYFCQLWVHEKWVCCPHLSFFFTTVNKVKLIEEEEIISQVGQKRTRCLVWVGFKPTWYKLLLLECREHLEINKQHAESSDKRASPPPTTIKNVFLYKIFWMKYIHLVNTTPTPPTHYWKSAYFHPNIQLLHPLFIPSFLFLNASTPATDIFTAPTCTTTIITLQPCALNAEFQHVISRFDQVSLLCGPHSKRE